MFKYYLAQSYLGTLAKMEHRHMVGCRCAAWLMAQGHTVYAPIPHGHAIANLAEPPLPRGAVFWWKQNKAAMDSSEQLAVLVTDCWEKSTGLTQEQAYAKACSMKIRRIEYLDGKFSWMDDST